MLKTKLNSTYVTLRTLRPGIQCMNGLGHRRSRLDVNAPLPEPVYLRVQMRLVPSGLPEQIDAGLDQRHVQLQQVRIAYAFETS